MVTQRQQWSGPFLAISLTTPIGFAQTRELHRSRRPRAHSRLPSDSLKGPTRVGCKRAETRADRSQTSVVCCVVARIKTEFDDLMTQRNVFQARNVRNHPVATRDCPFENARLRDSGALPGSHILAINLSYCLACKSKLLYVGIEQDMRLLPSRGDDHLILLVNRK